MAAQNSPFVEATYGWPYGSNGWDGDMNTNLVKFSYLHDRNIDAIVSSLPAIVNGKAYFNTADNRLYFDANGQRYSSVTPKWFEVTLRTTGQVYQFDGTTLNLGSTLVGFTQSGSGAVGRTSLEKLREVSVSINDFGAVPDGVTDNRLKIQEAINEVYSRGGGVVDFTAAVGFYGVGNSLWIPSGVKLKGAGGKTKASKIKRLNGMYTDLFLSGVHSEGTVTPIAGSILSFHNGIPYTSSNIGHGIAIEGLYIDGNGANAGTDPAFGASPVTYRGSNFRLFWTSGVVLNDVFSEFASNDGANISRCGRVSVTNSEFSNNFLLGGVIGDTQNGLTVSGSLYEAGLGSNDFLHLENIVAENTEDIGVVVQVRGNVATEATIPYGGTVTVSNIQTKGNTTGGTWVEVTVPTRPGVQNAVITNVISVNDGLERSSGFGVLISKKTRNVTLSNVVIRNSGSYGLVVSGGNNIIVDGVIVDGYASSPTVISGASGVFVYDELAVGTCDNLTLSNITILGGNGKAVDTYGMRVTGFISANLDNCTVNGTTYVSTVDSAGIFTAIPYLSITNSKSINSATNGFRITGFTVASLTKNIAKNSGFGNGVGAGKVGFNFGGGTNRRASIEGNMAYDDQGVPTQATGFLLGSSVSDSHVVVNNRAWGNTSAPISNLGGGALHYIHGNDFTYNGSPAVNFYNTSGVAINGTGAWDRGHITLGTNNHMFVDSFSVPRLKNSTPSSATDGFPFGLKVSVPATSTSTGAPGQWAASATFFYTYVGDGTTHSWVRSALATW